LKPFGYYLRHHSVAWETKPFLALGGGKGRCKNHWLLLTVTEANLYPFSVILLVHNSMHFVKPLSKA
jgi:hypothetical protein